MSWWNAKYTNGNGDNEITFGSKYYERAKAVEKVCQAVIDKKVKTPDDVEVVVRCKGCKHYDMGVCLKIYSDGNVHPEAWQRRKPDNFCSYGERKDGADAEG